MSAYLENWQISYRSCYTPLPDDRSKHEGKRQYLFNIADGWTDKEAAEILILAATAPRLLAACKQALPLLVEFCNLHPSYSDKEAIPRAVALADLRGAIAIAEAAKEGGA